jgi:hypothetical protein
MTTLHRFALIAATKHNGQEAVMYVAPAEALPVALKK